MRKTKLVFMFKIGDKVWIAWQDIDACGYGDSINEEGIIVGKINDGRFIVNWQSADYPYSRVEQAFYEHDLKVEI